MNLIKSLTLAVALGAAPALAGAEGSLATQKQVPAIVENTVGRPSVPGFVTQGRFVAYPDAREESLVEEHFGEQIADPYRWLENDVRSDSQVADWVSRQNAVSQEYLAALPQRAWFAGRIGELMNYERFGLPVKAGKRYFYTRNSGLQNQSQLYVRSGLKGAPRLLIDPNRWAKDNAAALADWVPAKNGKLLAYAVQDGGSDWRVIRVLDVKTGKVLADEIKWAKFTGIAWKGSEGFFYSRFPEPQKDAVFHSLNKNQAVYFHRVGTPQSADKLVYATPGDPDLMHSTEVTQNGRWAVITTARGTDDKFALHVIRLGKSANWAADTLVGAAEHDWRLIEGIGDRLYFITNKDAPRLRVVKMDLSSLAPWSAPTPQEVIPERAEVLARAQIVGTRLILSYMKDAASTAEMVALDGKPVQRIRLNAIGTASGFSGRPGDPETFYSFSSFNQPTAIYRFDSKTGQSSVFAQPQLTFNPDDYAVDQHFYASKDGTRVPMFVVRKKLFAAAGKAVPTLLYGYGGFNISLTPSFSSSRMAWMEAGGAFALVNLRGGGEYGKAWHDAGRLANKQNVFDDFIAAGEYLIAQGITPKHGLVIQGGSNGGLLVGAVVNQRPDLFAAAVPQVGVMDMLRFDRFTAGRYWVDDYGYPGRKADFKVLRAYSPYHNIRSGAAYPPVLVTTADTDDRVVPGHSFKYLAALQSADLGGKPHLIRIETRAGHGSGKPTDKAIAESADILSFFAAWSGLGVKVLGP